MTNIIMMVYAIKVMQQRNVNVNETQFKHNYDVGQLTLQENSQDYPDIVIICKHFDRVQMSFSKREVESTALYL